MDSSQQYTPVYRQFIDYLKLGFAVLKDEQQVEIKKFIQACQHDNGAFTDRAGLPDYYYSLFGTWLTVALELVNSIYRHKQFILQPEKKYSNPVDEFAALLIKTSLFGEKFRKPSGTYLLKRTFFNPGQVSLFYRMFLFVLLIDALYRRKVFNYAVRGLLYFISPPAGSPCSIWAAYIVARYKAGYKVHEEQKILLEFFESDKGFKAYKELAEADLLSTAVALFALKTAGADLRRIAPDCLELIQQNYDKGAFLAGNGDEDHDLEYTFYGLLALGILV